MRGEEDSSQVLLMGVFGVVVLLVLCYHLVQAHHFPPSFTCGSLGNLGYPFTSQPTPRPDSLTIFNCDRDHPSIQLRQQGTRYAVESISQSNIILINDPSLRESLASKSCNYFRDLDLPKTPFLSFHINDSFPFLKCNHTSHVHPDRKISQVNCSEPSGYEYSVHYRYHRDETMTVPPHCSIIRLPTNQSPEEANTSDLFSLLSYKFELQVETHAECGVCHHLGGECENDFNGMFHCAKRGNGKWRLKLGLILGLGIGWPLIVAIYIRRRCQQHQSAPSEHRTNGSSRHSSAQDPEEGSIHNGVYIFSYNKLKEATDNFKEYSEMSDGHFGVVYYGKLEDGREVTVKRLYVYNCRRLEQIWNEVEMLSRLRHRNLVSLYGCTSDLLLVYEFVPNATLAYHLRRHRSKSGYSMAWPVRMSIAIQIATALAYLHESNTIHADLNTDNILLHNDFTVKLSGFDISRLFPIDITHASMRPLGTPGYVDPGYLQCFQFTEKSDVYSFGVVLIELITSMPAFDRSKHIDEVSMANVAVKRMREGRFGEIVDPCVGFDKNEGTRNMIMLVAGLANLCLKQDKEMRPDMVEVVQILNFIQAGQSNSLTIS